eukprot:4991838-Alexandrium_andersonii.AAC.1
MGSSCFPAQSSTRPLCGNLPSRIAACLRLPKAAALGLDLQVQGRVRVRPHAEVDAVPAQAAPA